MSVLMSEELVIFTALINLSVSCFMLGVVWLVQLVSYPLFSYVNSKDFTKYHSVHMEKITPLVSIVMVLEVVVAFGLLFYTPTISGFILAINLSLVGFIWISTAFLQIPYHRSLAFPTNRIFYTKKLINTNWVRTGLWTLKSLLGLGLVISLVGV